MNPRTPEELFRLPIACAFGIGLLCLICGSATAGEAIWVEGTDAESHDFNEHNWYGTDDLRLDLMSPGVPEQSDGSWLVHYTGSDETEATASYEIEVDEPGTYTWWARLAAHGAAYEVRVGDGDWNRVVISDRLVADEPVLVPHEQVNVVDGLDIRTVGWVDLGGYELQEGTNTVEVRVDHSPVIDQTHGGVDAMVFVGDKWSPSGALRPGDVPHDPEPDDWFPLVDAASDSFSDNSLIDMTDQVDAHTGIPAGKYGPVQRVENTLELADRPDQPVKFWGTNSSVPANNEAMETQARFYVKHGINLVRRHYMLSELGEQQDPDRLDRYDRWFATLKEHGIYSDWSVFYPDNMRVSDDFLPDWDPDDPVATQLHEEFDDLLDTLELTVDDLWEELPESSGGRRIGGFDNFVYAYQQGQWEWLEPLLVHENPYTGMRYADDPALAIVEVQNEDSVFFHWPLNELAEGEYPNHLQLLRLMWFRWLGERYADDDELADAWEEGMRDGDSVEQFNPDMKVYGAWEMDADGPALDPDETARMGDFIRFLAETQRAHFQRRYDRLRETGFEGIVISTAWKAGGAAAGAANLWADDAADMISRHSYRGGGDGGHHVATGDVDAYTHLDEPGGGILSVGLWQVEDKPFAMTEWNVLPPNPWRQEMAPLFAFYGMGLQGWDASLHFSGSGERVRMGGGWPGAGHGPSSYVTETPAYLAQFPALSFAIYNDHISEGDIAAARRLPVDDIFQGIDALEQDFTGGGWDDPELVGNVATAPEVLAIGRVTAKFDDDLEPSSRLEWEDWWDEDDGVVTSTTEELVWDYDRRLVEVRTDRTQAVIGFAGGETIALPDVDISVDERTPYASLIFTPLDDAPLAESTSVLITAIARDRQTGTEYADDYGELVALGGPPLELQPVIADITFGGDPIEDVRALDFYGVPTETTVATAGDEIAIDGSYQTYYYHVRRQNGDQQPDNGDDGDTGVDSDTGVDAGPHGDGGPDGDAPTPDGDTADDGCGCSSSGPAGSIPEVVLAFAVLLTVRASRRLGCTLSPTPRRTHG